MTDTSVRYTGQYQFSRDDYLALTAALRPRNWGAARIILGVLWIAAWVLVIGAESKDWPQFVGAMRDLVTFHDVPEFIYLLIALGLAVIFLSPSLTMLRAMRLYSSFAIADQCINLVVDDAGLSTSGPNRQSRIEWPLIRRVIVTPSHLFFAISKREALVVPKRAFANSDDFVGVTALARAKVGTFRPA